MENRNSMADELLAFLRTRKKANLIIVAVNILVFIIAAASERITGTQTLMRLGTAYTPYILEGQYYRLVTAMFLHFGLAHLANNMICMLFIGDMVETAVGPVRYLVVCLGGGLLGNLCSMWWELRTGRFAFSEGASGCVFALIGAMLVLMAGARRIGAGSLVRRFALLAVLSVAQGFTQAGTDNAAHIGGLAGGIILMVIMRAAAIAKHRNQRQGRSMK